MNTPLSRKIYGALRRVPLLDRFLDRALAGMAGDAWRAQLFRGFIKNPHGAAYGVTESARAHLVEQFIRNSRAIPAGTPDITHVVLAQEILAVPPERSGDLIECGAWKGASTASLSLVARLVGRKLLVADSFRGLPDEGQKLHLAMHSRAYGYYKEGMFAGSQDEVRHNVARLGALSSCEFIAGFFADTLPALRRPLVFAFLDVDLVSSTRDCLRSLWPLLCAGGVLYTDDAADLDVVRVFFDEPFWQKYLGCPAPGYVGSGCGLAITPPFSSLGYVRKLAAQEHRSWQKVPWLHYPEGDALPAANQPLH